MRPTTKRRVVILVLVFLLGSLALGGIYEFRQYQINRQIMADRAAGMAAFHQGDYARALEPLSKYNARHPDDPETLFAFGKARSRVEAPNNRHLAEAIQYFRRGLELQPGNLDAKHQLLDLYSSTGYNAEAIALADDLLKSNASDVAALRTKASCLAYLRRFDQALAASTRLNQVAPLDVEGQVLTIRLMAILNKPAGEITELAKKNAAAHPGDPRFVMLQGLASYVTLDVKSATDSYRAAAAMPAPDAEFIKTCTGLMDEVGMFDDSQKLLERASADNKDPRMVRMLVQRLWENGRYTQVVDRLKDLNPATTASDSQLLAYKALSLCLLQKVDDAKPIIAGLQSRKDDDVALAWAITLNTRFIDTQADARSQISQYRAALVRDPGNTVARYLMGEAYSRLGETELALQYWRRVLDEMPAWAMPRTQIAYLLASTGRVEAAVKEAAAAYDRSKNLGSAIGYAVALASYIDRSNDPTAPQKLLNAVMEIQKAFPGEPQTFPIYVSLLGRTGHKDQAIAEIRTAMQKPYPLGTDAWLRVAAVSRKQGLGLEQAILAQAQKAYGFTPQIALANAVILSEKDPQGGLDYLTKAAASASGDRATWKLALAQYKEQIHDPKARDAWIELGDGFADDLNIQSAITDLPDDSSAWQDRAFIDRTVQRLHSLTGDNGFRWQLAYCRWLLTGPHDSKNLADAVVRLSGLVRAAPNLVTTRLYLAKALEASDQVPAALEQLRAVSDADDQNVAVALEIVRLLQNDGKFADARPYLDRAAKAAPDAQTRQRVAYFYAQQGLLDPAIALVAPAAGSKPTPEGQAMLAGLLRRKGNFEEAGKIYRDLAAAPDADPTILAAAADFFAAHNEMDQARSALDRLSKSKLGPGRREALLAAYDEKHGSKQTAEQLLQQAVQAAPADAELWQQLITFQLRQNQFEGAVATCDQALKQLPGNETVTSLRNQAVALRAANGKVDTEALVAELSKDPQNQAAADSLAAFAEIRNSKLPPDRAVEKLRAVADRYPRFLPVQTQLVRMYLQLGKSDDAAAVAARAMDSFPNDPVPASLATAVNVDAGRWNDALIAAQEWRKRSLEQPLEADLAIATVRMHLNQAAEAAKQLQPYLAAAKADPDKNNAVIGTYAQALVMDSRESDAAELLSPYLSHGDDWRVGWLRLSPLLRNPQTAAKWIEQGAAAVPADSLRGQYEVAQAWYACGIRFQQPEFFKKAHQAITPLTTRADVTPAILGVAASIADKVGDAGQAIALYHRALQMDEHQAGVQNNLAFLLLTRGQDLDEARQLAEKACAAEPRNANYYDTLARVYAKVGQKDRAIAAFQKVLDIEPNNVQAMAPTIRLLREQGQPQAASALFQKLQLILQSNPSLQSSISDDLEALNVKQPR